MNSRFGVSRQALFDILAVVVAVGGIFLSRFLRSAFPAPSGKAWLWGCVAIGTLVAWRVAARHGFSGLHWMLLMVGVSLSLQILLQVGFSYGIISF